MDLGLLAFASLVAILWAVESRAGVMRTAIDGAVIGLIAAGLLVLLLPVEYSMRASTRDQWQLFATIGALLAATGAWLGWNRRH
ncbi:MAG: hypothetical protein WD847_16625 [Pirellulales bacterium]